MLRHGRLVKELRLRGISDRAAGNAYLNEFREDYNRPFACIPRKDRNAHRPLLAHENLDRVFSWQEQRPGAIVENKLLAHTLQLSGMAQRKRDEDKLASGKMTLRDEDLLRKAMGQQAGLLALPGAPRHASSRALARRRRHLYLAELHDISIRF
jgi:hypothetical protein